MMEKSIGKDVPDAAAYGDLRLGEMQNDSVLVLYLAQQNESMSCPGHKIEHCLCSTKVHHEIDGEIVCIRDMRPFVHIKRLRICCRREDKP
jgi:hypothetical protein